MTRAFLSPCLVATAALACACSAGKPKAPASSPPGSYAIGQPVTVGAAEITIDTVIAREELGAPGHRQEARPGDVLIVLRDSVRNVGQSPLPASAFPRLGLVDPAGAAHDSDAALTAAYQTEAPAKAGAGDLAPGASMDVAQVFEVSAATYPAGWAIFVGDPTRRVELK